MGDSFNINNSGKVGQQNIGQSGGTANADISFGGQEVTLAEIVEKVKAEFDDQETQTLLADYKSVIDQEPEQEFKASLVDRIKEAAGKLVKSETLRKIGKNAWPAIVKQWPIADLLTPVIESID